MEGRGAAAIVAAVAAAAMNDSYGTLHACRHVGHVITLTRIDTCT